MDAEEADLTINLEVEPIVHEQCLLMEDDSYILGPPVSPTAPLVLLTQSSDARDTGRPGYWVQNWVFVLP